MRTPIWPCSGWSLPCRELLPAARCALTAPFHPYLIPLARAIGGLLSVALVVGLRPPGVTWHPALWSPDFPPLRPSPRKDDDEAATVWSASAQEYRGFTLACHARPFSLRIADRKREPESEAGSALPAGERPEKTHCARRHHRRNGRNSRQRRHNAADYQSTAENEQYHCD